MPLVSFYTHLKHQKSSGSLMFSGEIERDQCLKWFTYILGHLKMIFYDCWSGTLKESSQKLLTIENSVSLFKTRKRDPNTSK